MSKTPQTRTRLFRRVVRALRNRRLEREAISRYREGYIAHPETSDEIAVLHELARRALSQEH